VHAEKKSKTPSNNNQTVYVTDALQLKLFAKKKGEGKILDSLHSGDALTLIKKQGAYSFVSTQQGTQGWVTSFYLTKNIPTQRKLKDLEKQLASRNASIKTLEERLQNMTAQEQPGQDTNPGLLAELESKVVILNQENVMMANEKEQLRKKLVQAELAIEHSAPNTNKETTQLMALINKLPFTFPLYGWLGISLGVGLIFGFFLGYKHYSNKLKKRFYGFRI
jgi:SH3 domain protein